MINTIQFWNIIEASRRRLDPHEAFGNMERQLGALRRLLLELPPEQIIDFRGRFREHLEIAFRWDLWGAASLIAGGCSNDGFVYFRQWLISMGQRVFQDALADPESLAEAAEAPGVEDVFFEEFAYVAAEAYEEVTGRELPPYRGDTRTVPMGDPWSPAGDEFPRRFPRLWARYRSGS